MKQLKKLILLIVFAIIISTLSKTNEYIEIPSSSIRMRVIANSNSEEDQAKKTIVKSILEEKLYEILEDSHSLEELDEKITDNKTEIDDYLTKEIELKKLNVTFQSNYGENYFPEKEFKGIVYKAGNYKSYVVSLDSGKGDNWWCVLYPPLCLIDENTTDYEYHYLIKDAISKYN